MIAHPKTTPTYKYTADENRQVIRMLCEQYPACFFEEGRQRRPLRSNIAADIILAKDLKVAEDLIHAAVGFYHSHEGPLKKFDCGRVADRSRWEGSQGRY